jgi:hypothetical protein
LKALTLDSRLADKQIWRAEAALMLALSIGSVMLFSSLEHALMTVVQVGYFVCSDALFESILNDAMPEIHQKVGEVFPGVALPADGASFLRTLEQLRPSVTRSLYGSPIRRAEAALFVDLYAATQRLEHAFEFPAFQGEEGNARGDHFEDAAQAIIDASGWRPSSDLRLLRRRTLRANGKDVTDVDAVAERDGTALLISCKSKIYSESYHSGDYRSVRNIASAIEEAVGEAAHNTALLDRHRKGDNYDLTRFSRIVIPVITPITVYTPIGASTDFILDGLRASASISELSQFLQRP